MAVHLSIGRFPLVGSPRKLDEYSLLQYFRNYQYDSVINSYNIKGELLTRHCLFCYCRYCCCVVFLSTIQFLMLCRTKTLLTTAPPLICPELVQKSGRLIKFPFLFILFHLVQEGATGYDPTGGLYHTHGIIDRLID